MKIALISCVSKKINTTTKAKDIYISPLFKKSYNYAILNNYKIYILSAKYYLLKPDDIITNYNLTLNNFNELEKKKWAFKIYNQLSQEIDINDEIVWLCGYNYKKYLNRLIKNKQIDPLKGLSIGKRLQWLNTKI